VEEEEYDDDDVDEEALLAAASSSASSSPSIFAKFNPLMQVAPSTKWQIQQLMQENTHKQASMTMKAMMETVDTCFRTCVRKPGFELSSQQAACVENCTMNFVTQSKMTRELFMKNMQNMVVRFPQS